MNAIRHVLKDRRVRRVLVGLLLASLLLSPAGTSQAQSPGSRAVDPQTARRVLLSGRLLPVDASLVPPGATSQAFFPIPVENPVAVQTGSIAFETDRNGGFDLYVQPADGTGSAAQLVTGPGEQITPAWSPDGRKVAFAGDQDGNFEIYLRDENGQVHNLTSNTADDAHPAWSLAGDRIFFTSDRGGGYFQIYSMRSDGGDVRQVGSVDNNHAMAPTVSPDGQRIAFMRASVLDPLCQWNWDIWVMNQDGTNPQRITNHLAADLYPTWTPDGSEIVLAGCHNFLDFDLYATNVATGSQRRLTNWFLTNEWDAGYAADGAHLAFSTDRDGNVEVYTMPTAGGTAANLTRHPADDLAASWRGQTGGETYRVAGRVVDGEGQGLAGVRVADNAGRSVVTDATGNFALENLPAGVHTLTPTKAGFTFGPRFLQATVPPNASGLIFRGYDRPPIVFVHGIQIFNPSTIIFPYDPDEATFHEIDELLEVAGYHAAFAHLETSPLYTPPLSANVQNVTRAIADALAQTGQRKVILITHSMGGLVSRAYLESDLFRGRADVLDLFTFGTPHHGVPSDVLIILLGAVSSDGLGALCLNYQPAVCEFSVTGMALFNLLHPNRADGVAYHLISGNAPLNEVTGMSHLVAQLTPGPDDGLVPTSSGTGRWLSGIYERWEGREVHGAGSGSHSYFKWNDRPQGRSDSYNHCLEPILVNGRSTCQGSVTTSEASQQAPSVHSPIEYGHLLPGAMATHQLTVEAGQVVFATQWTTGTLLMTLVSPTGMTIDPAYAASHPNVVTYETSAGWAGYTFAAAAAGRWRVRLQGTGLPPIGVAYATLALFESDLRLTGGGDQPWVRPGATVALTASLSTTTQSALVSATLLLADGSSSALGLTPVGGERFEGRYVAPNVPGYVEVRFRAEGTMTGGAPFERSYSALFQISPSTATLSGSYSDTPVPRWPGASVYAALDVAAGVAVVTTGEYSLSADLVDDAGNLVAHALTSDTLATGSQTLTLRFSGSDIYESRRNGPYTLTNVLLVDNASAALVIQEAQTVYVTRPYAARDFRVGDIFLPAVWNR